MRAGAHRLALSPRAFGWGARGHNARLVRATKAAAARYAIPTSKLAQYGPVKPGKPWRVPIENSVPPYAHARISTVLNMVPIGAPLSGGATQPSHGPAAKNAAITR